jgi:hypothetical protein
MLFWKEHAIEKKCLECDQLRFIEVVTQDGEKVMTEVAHKHLCYFPITHRLKWLFISKRTMRHMRWHKEGIRENDGVMGHPSDGEAWKVLDRFDANYASDVRNVHFGLATDGFDPFSTIKYVHVSIAWLKDCPEAYRALCKIWVSEEFIAKSMKA